MYEQEKIIIREKIDHKKTQKILDFYENISTKDAIDVVARWRRDVDYLKAIRELEISA